LIGTVQRGLGNRKKNLEGLFSSVWGQLKKYHPSENQKFNNLSIFQKLKLRNLMEKSPLNFCKAKFHSKYFGLLWVKVISRGVANNPTCINIARLEGTQQTKRILNGR